MKRRYFLLPLAVLVSLSGALLAQPGNFGIICLKACSPEGDGLEANLAVYDGSPLPIFLSTTNLDGCYAFTTPLPSPTEFTPFSDGDPTDGVTTYDLVLINRHILNVTPLNSPYKIIAADANKSGTVTMFDILELRRLILGVYNELPYSASWRFVRATQTFPAPNNPFTAPLQESVTATELAQALPNSIDFVGVKIGDVNCTASPNATTSADDRQPPLAFRVPDLELAAGETAEIPFQLLNDEHLLGLQLRLNADPNLLEISAVNSPLPGFNPTNWLLRDNALALSWDEPLQPLFSTGSNLLRVQVRARQSLRLSEVLRLDTHSLQPEAYTGSDERHPIELWFAQPGQQPTRTEVFATRPNPTADGFQIPVRVDADTDLNLRVFDTTGRLVFQQQQHTTAGTLRLDVPAQALASGGVFAWHLSDGRGRSWSGQVVRQ